jgi:hypothetical protein
VLCHRLITVHLWAMLQCCIVCSTVTQIFALLICAFLNEFYMFYMFCTLPEFSSVLCHRLTTKHPRAMLLCCIMCSTKPQIPLLLICAYLNESNMFFPDLTCSGHSRSCAHCSSADAQSKICVQFMYCFWRVLSRLRWFCLHQTQYIILQMCTSTFAAFEEQSWKRFIHCTATYAQLYMCAAEVTIIQ